MVQMLKDVITYLCDLRAAMKAESKGWIICGAVLFITVIRSGITYSFGVFAVQLQSIYHRPMSEINWIGTLSFCISLSMAPLSVAFIRCFKYRGYRIGGMSGTIILGLSCLCSSFVGNIEWMFLTHSLLYGIGSGLIYMASSLVIGEYFDKDHRYHVLATSILLCGYPLGSLIFNPINAWLVTKFGWRVAFRVSSGLILTTGVACTWTFSSKETPNMERLEEEESEDGDRGSHFSEAMDRAKAAMHDAGAKLPRRCCTFSEIKARPEIILWYLANMLSYLGFFTPFLDLVSYMKKKGISTTRASWAITLLSFAECVTYIMASFLGDKLKGKLVYINIIAAAAIAIICIIWPMVDVSYGIIVITALILGGFLGLTIVYTYAASGEVTQLPIDIAWSFTNLWSGLGIMVGPFFSGTIYDLRKNYDDVFYVTGAVYILDAIMFASIPMVGYYRRKHAPVEYDEIQGLDYSKTTLKISNRELSKNSLVGEDIPVVEYGTTSTSEPVMAPPTVEREIPQRPPPPKMPEIPNGYGTRQNINPFLDK